MSDLPTPPYTEATGPKAEAKPSNQIPDVPAGFYRAATDRYIDVEGRRGTGAAVRAVARFGFECGLAAGRAQAAADIRAEAAGLPNLQVWAEGTADVIEYCARLAGGAEGGGVAEQSKDTP